MDLFSYLICYLATSFACLSPDVPQVLMAILHSCEEAAISSLVHHLGSEDYAVREAAGKALTQTGEACRSALDKARESSTDPELRARVSDVLERLDNFLYRPIRVFRGHSGFVFHAAFSPDGTWALSGGGDNTVRLWDVQTGKQLQCMRGHTKYIYCVRFNPKGTHALSCSHDNTIRLWDLKSGQEIRRYQGHTNAVLTVCFSLDGTRFLSGSCDHTLRLWDVASGKELCRLKGHTGNVWSAFIKPDGKQAISTSSDQTVRLWDLEKGRELRQGPAPICGLSCLAPSLDGKWGLAVNTGPDADYRLHFVDTETCKEKRWLSNRPEEQSMNIREVALSSDGKRAVSTDGTGWIEIWDVAKATRVWAMSSQLLPDKKDRETCFGGVALSPDGKWALISTINNDMWLWKVAPPGR